MAKNFFLRFYGPRSKDRAKRVLSYAHNRGHEFSFKYADVKLSVNPIRPEESVQVELAFSTEADRKRWMDDANLKEYYGKNATLEGDAEVVTQKRGDLAFS